MTEQPSGRLYSAVTKYWPRLAVGLEALLSKGVVFLSSGRGVVHLRVWERIGPSVDAPVESHTSDEGTSSGAVIALQVVVG